MVRPARTAPGPGDAGFRDAAACLGPGGVAAGGPIVVLSYAHGGEEVLGPALSASPGLACTRSSGLLPLCHGALMTWQRIEGRETPSALAVKSVRTLVAAMAITVQSATGAARWCEIAYAGAPAAESFLRVFPDAAFACVHRSLPAVIAEISRTYPWGLGGSVLWRHAAGHPGDNLAAITAYWAACASDLLDFEAAHPRSCIRVRAEDLAGQPGHVAAVLDHLGAAASLMPAWLDQDSKDRDPVGAEPSAASQRPPLEQLPPQLLARASDLHARLGYLPFQPEPGIGPR
jgi:hypothetical protein